MGEYQHKDKYVLSYDAGVKRIRLEGRIALDQVLNDAIDAWSREHEAAKKRGEVLELTGDRDALMVYLRASARKALTS
jgi:hypothetical protein